MINEFNSYNVILHHGAANFYSRYIKLCFTNVPYQETDLICHKHTSDNY